MAAMLPSLKIRRSGWRDLFIGRELTHVPSGVDRYVMLVVKALAACLGTWIISLGPVAAPLVPSEHFSVSDYGYIAGGAGWPPRSCRCWPRTWPTSSAGRSTRAGSS